MATCPNCGLWEGLHASGEYCRCSEDGWHNAQPIPQPEPDVPAEAHTAQCAAYQSRIAELESTIDKLTHRPSVMNARDAAINIAGCLEVRAEPAGTSGAFWSIAGPRRTGRNVAEMDAATIRTSIAQALLARDDKIAALEAQVKALTAELEEYRLRLAGALIASEGGNGQPDGAIEAIRTCPTITSVMQLRKERDAQAEAVRVLGGYVRLGEVAWDNNLLMWDSGEQEGSFPELPRQWEEAAQAVHANTIARAAVEGGKRED